MTLQKLLREPVCAADPRIEIVPLLKIDVLEQIAARSGRRERVAVHVDSVQLRDDSFNRHQPLTQVLANPGLDCRILHKAAGRHSVCHSLERHGSRLTRADGRAPQVAGVASSRSERRKNRHQALGGCGLSRNASLILRSVMHLVSDRYRRCAECQESIA